MKLTRAALGNGGKAVDTAKGKRWQVRWYLLSPGTPFEKERKRTNFTHRENAKEFIKVLHKADLGIDGWCFDHSGDPVQRSGLAPAVLLCVEAYVEAKWRVEWKPKTRQRALGRLRELVIHTLIKPADRAKLAKAYEAQRRDRGARSEPKNDVELAARWLRDHSFLPHSPATDGEVVAGRTWLERNSLPISAVDTAMAAQLRNIFGGSEAHEASTQRTYWEGVIVPFLNWCTDTDRLQKNPLRGLTKMRRDVELERPEAIEIPEIPQVAALAQYFGDGHGELWELWVFVVCYCALRKGESFAITGTSFRNTANGRWTLAVQEQENRVTADASDDGATTQMRTGTKATRGSTKPTRQIPVPAWLADRLVTYFGERLGRDERHLFVGPRGAIGPTSVDGWFRDAVAHCFGTDPHLSQLTPHSLRHTGMTYWFAAGIDHARIQKWGGWSSLKEMLDTYRHIIGSLEEQQLTDLDAFHARWSAVADATSVDPTEAEPVPPVGGMAAEVNMLFVATSSEAASGRSAQRSVLTGDAPSAPVGAALVLDLDEFRRRRLAQAT